MSRLPKIFAHCPAGCKWETIHRDEFLRSASLVEVYPDENGKWYLEPKKQYKIFAPKDDNGAFSFDLRVHYMSGAHRIVTVTNDEYADCFVFRLLDYKSIDGNSVKIVYEIEGNRYAEIIASASVFAGDYPYLVLSGATQVFIYNDDATVYARDGADGGGEDAEARKSISNHLQAHDDGRYDELPYYTAEDNGKVPTIEDGKIVWKNPTGGGASGTYYTIAIPSATDTDLKGWAATASGYELLISDVAWMTEDLFIELKCENSAVFTEHNLMLHQDNGFMDFSIDSLPEKASTLYIVVPNYTDGGLLNGGDA